MPVTVTDYSRVFNRLVHLVALSKDGKIQAVVDNLILTIFALDKYFTPTTLSEISEAIKTQFSLKLGNNLLQSSLDRNINAGHIIIYGAKKQYNLNPVIRIKFEQRIIEATELEAKVKKDWIASLGRNLKEDCPEHLDHLWNCLQLYLKKVFHRHGAETIRLLTPTAPLDNSISKGLVTYLDEAVKNCCDEVCSGFAILAIQSFFQNPTSQQTRYMVQLMDGTFTFFALTVDGATSSFLRHSLSPLALFLDSNFIFGILKLSSNPLVDVSQELVDFIKVHKLPFRIFYHQKTLEELQNTIHSVGDRLKSQRWQRSISRGVVSNQITAINGIELAYHQMNAVSPIDPDTFISKYSNLEVLLENYGFNLFPAVHESHEEMETRGMLVAEYKEFIERSRPERPKPYVSLNHDVSVWLTVQKQRNKNRVALETGALFLTNDFYLHRFDWETLRKKNINNPSGSVVLPNHLLQLLRPFVPVTDDFDRRFVETLALPSFRVIENDYSDTISNVIAYLNHYSDLDDKIAAQILANQLLIQDLSGMDPSSQKFKDKIDNALAQANNELLEEIEALEIEKADALNRAAVSEKIVEQTRRQSNQKILSLNQTLTETAASAQQAQSKANEFEKALQKNETDGAEKERAYTERINELQGSLQKANEKNDFLKRIGIGSLVALTGIILTLLLPAWFPWTWFDNHPKKLGLYLSAILLWIIIGCVILDKKNRRITIYSVFLPVIFVILQIM